MGVLDYIWTGKHTHGPDGTMVPVERPAVLADVDDPEGWWEIPSRSALAKKIRLYYPLLRPVTGPDGQLVDVVILRPEEGQEAAQEARDALKKEAAQRGYKRPGKVRPRGLMPFLSCTQPCNIDKNTSKG